MIQAARRKFHIIYKTTCVLTDKFYIGMHSTDNLGDGYLGSGQLLWRSIKKYGRENHKCEILEYHTNRKALADREKEILTEDFRNHPLCMNLREGGIGGYPGRPVAEETKRKLSESRKGMKFSDEHRANISKAGKGRVISDEQKKKVSEKLKGKPSTNNRLIVVNGKEYPSLDAAALETGIKRTTIGKRIQSKKFLDTYYKDSSKE